MTYSLYWRSAAYQDLEETFRWYQEQAPHQLARLEAEIAAAEQELCERPLAFRPLTAGARRFALKVFPFQIWYAVNEPRREIQVVAPVHGKRDISTYFRRLS